MAAGIFAWNCMALPTVGGCNLTPDFQTETAVKQGECGNRHYPITRFLVWARVAPPCASMVTDGFRSFCSFEVTSRELESPPLRTLTNSFWVIRTTSILGQCGFLAQVTLALCIPFSGCNLACDLSLCSNGSRTEHF